MNEDITNSPLYWPVSQERTEPHKRRVAQFGKSIGNTRRPNSIAYGSRALEHEIRLLEGCDLIISTNLKVKADGLPYSNQRQPEDSGVAAYFKWHDRDLVFACDKWTLIEDNLWAIVKHIEALRGQERWGVGSLDQAFAGYAALPDPDTRPWWDVLGVVQTAANDEIRSAYLNLAKIHHPDAGGESLMFDQITKAYQLAMGKV